MQVGVAAVEDERNAALVQPLTKSGAFTVAQTKVKHRCG